MSFPMRRRSFGRRRTSGLSRIIDSNKNVVSNFTAAATGANTLIDFAIAVDSAALATTNEVERGCKIFKVWLELWISASAATAVGVTTGVDAYVFKTPGNNLTAPQPGTIGSSNEKKFIFKTFKGLVGARTEGYPSYTWKGWIKIPRIYQRMGADDQLTLVIRPTGVNLIVCTNFIYKWYK